MKKNIKKVAKAVAKEKERGSPSISGDVFDVIGGHPSLAIPFTKKMKK